MHSQRHDQWWRFVLQLELSLKICISAFGRLSNNFHVINHQQKVYPHFLESFIYISGTWIPAFSCEIT